MKYPKWQYKFMHNRLTEMGYKPQKIQFKRADYPFHVGLYSKKGGSLIHIEDMIRDYRKFVEKSKKECERWQNTEKKPVVIEAIQFNGSNFKEVFDWVGQWQPEDDGQGMWQADDGKGHLLNALIVDTAEGEMRADPGDWIIREPFPTSDRKFYPCKSDIFEPTYEEVK